MPVTAWCEAQGKAQGLPFHPGVTGKGKTGRVNASSMLYPLLRRINRMLVG